MEKPYTSMERARMRASFLSPEISFDEWLRAKVPSAKDRRSVRERLNKGARMMHILERLNELFDVHVMFWLEDSREAIERMAKGEVKVSYKSVSKTRKAS